MRNTALATILALGLTMTLDGCAQAARSSAVRGERNVLTREQLASSGSGNLYDAIAKLRPDWLVTRGPTSVTDPTPATVSVFMNGQLLGKADYLRQVAPIDVTEIRYWDAGQASARFGMGHPRGVIELTLK